MLGFLLEMKISLSILCTSSWILDLFNYYHIEELLIVVYAKLLLPLRVLNLKGVEKSRQFSFASYITNWEVENISLFHEVKYNFIKYG